MNKKNCTQPVVTLATRTFRQYIESPIIYVVAIFFYGFIGFVFGINYFLSNQVSIEGIGQIALWVLWFVVPATTMGLISEEIRTGTFEQLATLPLNDWEIVLGKFLGYAALAAVLVAGLSVYPLLVSFSSQPNLGLEFGPSLGVLIGLYLLMLLFGAMGLFASSLTKSQVVSFILGTVFCTIFFFIGQFTTYFPSVLGRIADFIGVDNHLSTLARGIYDFRDLFYFGSGTALFLYLAIQRITTRRF
jgi:ABC-2 type transport system permease protein